MKKLLIIAASAALLCSCGKPKFVVQGEIADLEGTVYLFGDQKEVPIDSVVVVDGKFRLQGEANPVAVYTLMDGRGRPAKLHTYFIPEKGTIIIASTDDKSSRKQATGTPANDARAAFNTAAQTLMKEYNDEATTEERREAIDKEYEQLEANAVEANKDNFFGVMSLQSNTYGLTGQEILDKIAILSPEMQASDAVVKLKEMAQQKIKTEIGQPYINIEQPNAEGQTVSLKSVIDKPENKYTLVDFWASWCGPCMGEVPVMKKTYDEFHAKGFEIYGVSFDNNREKWLAAIADKGLNWVHVSEVKSFDNQAAKDYAVQGIPTNLLIDSKGVIVARNLRGEALYNKVAELLK